jgi:glycine dehydrogenase subunit 2
MKDITRERYDENGKPKLRRFHQACWDESIIFELSTPGERGILVPEPEDAVKAAAENPLAALPESMRRALPPALPEMGQLQVLRHYLRLSQENLGMDLNIDVGQGTCTMKYSPKINEQLAELHPLQDERSVQGILQVYYEMDQILREISGMAQFSFQPQAGSQAIYANVSMIRAYHASRGEDGQRDEIITTIFSHPSNAACAKTAGYKIITLYPDSDGYPDLEALKTALSGRTAALLITNPEDTGIYNPKILEFTRLVHEAGGLCCYDQANANGLLGITRAGDAGFDLCHFNLHKTFYTPHGCGGPGSGVSGVSEALAKFLPVPVVTYDDERYNLDYDRPESIGKIRCFFGVAPVVLKAYAWIMSLGAEGLKTASETAVLNNNYLLRKMLAVRGVSVPYAQGRHRIEQVRYSLEKLANETGIHSEEIGIRAADFGVHYWTSHHPLSFPLRGLPMKRSPWSLPR